MTPADADIIAVKGASWFGRLLAWAQTEADGTGQAGHLAVAFTMTQDRRWFLVNEMRLKSEDMPDPGTMCVIEAHYFVRVMSWAEFVYSRRKDKVGVIHCDALGEGARDRIVRHVLTYAGEPYSVRRLLLMGWSRLTGQRAALKMRGDKPVCSYLPAKPYFVETGVYFQGASYKETTPDDVCDHARSTPGWSLIWRDQ